MTSTIVRQYIVVLGGIGIGAWLIAATAQQLRPQGGFSMARGRMHGLDVAARLTFGSALMLIALSLLAGHVLTAQDAALAAPGWVVALGAVLLVTAALSGVVVGIFIVVRWRQPRVW